MEGESVLPCQSHQLYWKWDGGVLKVETCLKSRPGRFEVRHLMAVKTTCCLYVLALSGPRNGPVRTAMSAVQTMDVLV